MTPTEYTRQRRSENRQKYNDYMRNYRNTHPVYKRNTCVQRRERDTGWTQEQYNVAMAAQRGMCAICDDAGPMCADHDHNTGSARKLLCDSCNLGLGKFKDDPELFRRAIAYLETL